MEYFDFIRPGDLDNLPEDSQLAFAEFVKLAQARLIDRLEKLDPQDNGAWEVITEAKHGFQNVVMGAARRFGIEPFATADVPRLANYQDEQYRQFRADLSNYITQIMLSAADYDRSNSVPLRDETKESIRTYLYYLREAIDRDESLSTKTKQRMHERVNDVEAELARPRIRIATVATAAALILAMPHDASDSYNAIARLVTSVMREIGTAKAADNEQRHISTDPPVAFLPLRKAQEPSRSELDDEIPF